MERLAGMAGMAQTPEWVKEFLARMEGTGWSRLVHLLLVAAACIAILGAVKLVTRAVRRAVDDGNEEVTSDAERRAETLGAVLTNAARVVVVAFFLLMTLQEFGVNIGPLVAGAGIAGVAVGFGAQSLVKDVISGFFLLMENQFGVGDIINIDDKHTGTVERMTLRITQLRDSEGRAHYVPNGSIIRVVVLSKDFARALVDVEVGYDTDPDRAFEVLRQTGKSLHDDKPELAVEPLEVKGIETLGANGFVIRTLTKTAPGAQWEVARELRRRILLAFREAGIEIPYAQRVVHHRGEGVGGED
ncbi:mechanosensitive ion channel family protein [Geothrix sp. PMB-07]|uniref:mechanosensitive ion channel family protein n=1 Tax=Geothrix sp. PMB-07 TaxID=3068640 RepID=UPI0027407A62|nr:mechanosensitive ion channel family protein [Geothrix sp. PMB-07]WLT32187.1 mechanosensitive ion channel family protein [Geothrix sp. PMB-07]